MKIGIIGAGAVGSIVAVQLAQAGLEPRIFARTGTREILLRDGITIVDGSESQHFMFSVVDDLARLSDVDLAICGLKSHAWPTLAPMFDELKSPLPVIPILNGIPWWYNARLPLGDANRITTAVDPDGAILGRFDTRQVVGAIAYIRGSRVTPAKTIRGPGNKFILGVVDGGTSALLPKVRDLLTRARFEVDCVPDIRPDIWKKLLLNATFNPVSVLAETAVDVIASSPETRSLVRAMMGEVSDVAFAEGVDLRSQIEGILDSNLAYKGFKTSMLQDFEKGERLELGATVGAVIELARRHAIPVPNLQRVLSQVEEKLSRATG